MHVRARTSLLGPFVAALIATLALCIPAVASAEGRSFAAATAVQYGVPQFGNTAAPAGECGNTYGHWSLAVTAGDRVTLDIQGAWQHGYLFPIGTDDFNTDMQQYDGDPDGNSPFKETYSQSNGKARLTFSAPRTGAMPFVVSAWTPCNSEDESEAGPYDFVATVQHGLRLAMTSPNKRVRRRFTSVFAVNSPDGAAITDPTLLVQLQAKLKGRWVTLGSAPAQQGSAGVLARLPRSTRGKKVKLRGRAEAGGYVTAVSAVRSVHVLRK